MIETNTSVLSSSGGWCDTHFHFSRANNQSDNEVLALAPSNQSELSNTVREYPLHSAVLTCRRHLKALRVSHALAPCGYARLASLPHPVVCLAAG